MSLLHRRGLSITAMVNVTATARPYGYRACRCLSCGRSLTAPDLKQCPYCGHDTHAPAETLAGTRRHGAGKRDGAAVPARTLTIAEAYGVLGVPLSATPAEIRTGLHRAVAQWHPDRLEGMAEELRAWATQKTATINAAYEVVRQSAIIVREL